VPSPTVAGDPSLAPSRRLARPSGWPDRRRRDRERDPEPAGLDVAAGHQLLQALVGDERGEDEELGRDEHLRPALGTFGQQPRSREAPDDDDAGDALDGTVKPERDERDRARHDPGDDRHRPLDAEPDEAKPGEPPGEPGGSQPVVAARKRDGRGGGCHLHHPESRKPMRTARPGDGAQTPPYLFRDPASSAAFGLMGRIASGGGGACAQGRRWFDRCAPAPSLIRVRDPGGADGATGSTINARQTTSPCCRALAAPSSALYRDEQEHSVRSALAAGPSWRASTLGGAPPEA
jgi:hypothetical protein